MLQPYLVLTERFFLFARNVYLCRQAINFLFNWVESVPKVVFNRPLFHLYLLLNFYHFFNEVFEDLWWGIEINVVGHQIYYFSWTEVKVFQLLKQVNWWNVSLLLRLDFNLFNILFSFRLEDGNELRNQFAFVINVIFYSELRILVGLWLHKQSILDHHLIFCVSEWIGVSFLPPNNEIDWLLVFAVAKVPHKHLGLCLNAWPLKQGMLFFFFALLRRFLLLGDF